MSQSTIRPYRPADRQAVREIAYGTAFMGRSIADQYRDFESMADLLSGYYTDCEPENAFIAEREGRVVGYLLAARDARRATSSALIVLKHVLLRAVCLRPGTARFYARSLRDAFADLATAKPKLDLNRYPGNTHSNFLPEARGDGVSTHMFFQLFDKLKREGTPGMHAEVFAENLRTLRWACRTLGYAPYGDPYPVPGIRGERGERLHLQLIVKDLSSWQPGAWQEAQPSA